MYARQQEIELRSEVAPSLNDILGQINQLAVLPHVVFKVLELSGSEDSAATDMERVITVDPAFSAKLLSQANSAYYGLSRKVTSIRDAIVYMGFRSVREIALTVGVFDMFVGKNDKESLRRRAWWRHSVDAAICCRYLAEITRKLDPEEAYTCGLLHYIGKTLLDRFGKRDYAVVEIVMQSGVGDIEAEHRVYGCTHEDVAVGAAEKWGLPQAVTASLRYSEEPKEPDENSKYAACVALGSSIARRAVDRLASDEPFPLWALAELGILPSTTQEICERAWERLANSSAMHF